MKRLCLSILLALLMLVGIALPVFAINEPDTPPQVSAVYVYEDLLEDGDVGVLIDYYLDYASTPNTTATDAFMAVFIDTDGVTQLKASAPYTFQDSGYGRGLIWIYFEPDEVTAYGITSANEALYDIWLAGNPTLAWNPGPDPPKTIVGIDYWQPAGSSAETLLALRILYYADQLELIWALDMIEQTALGNRLTTVGESYFENVIPDLRDMAPACFSAGEYDPTIENLTYETEFGALAVSGTGNVTSSPVTLTEGASTITANSTGTLFFYLSKGTSGNVSNGTGNISGSPVDLVWGTNTVNCTVNGTLALDLELITLATTTEDTVTGTGLDLSALAAIFGMSRWAFSGLVWLLVSVLVCWAAHRVQGRSQFGYGGASGKTILLVFDICIIGGTVLGMIHPIVAIMMFIGFGAFTGYVLFFKGANV